MKRTFMITVLLLLLLPAMSQVQVGLSFQPNWSFKNRDLNWFNYSISAKSSFVLYRNLSVILGIGYAPEKYDELGWANPIDRLIPDLYYYHLIQTELQLSYNFFDRSKKLSFYGLGGLLLSTSIYQKSEYSSPPPETRIDNSINVNNVYLNIGFGLQYRIKDISFAVEPLYYYSLKEVSFFKDRVGINCVIYYRFARKANNNG